LVGSAVRTTTATGRATGASKRVAGQKDVPRNRTLSLENPLADSVRARFGSTTVATRTWPNSLVLPLVYCLP